MDDVKRDLEAMLSTPAGMRVIWWLLEVCGVYRDAFTGEDGSRDYILGQQSIGRRVISAMDAIDLHTYPRLMLAIADLRTVDKHAAEMAAKQEDDDEPAP